MDFRNVGNLRVLFLKSSKHKHVRMRHFFQFESPTLQTRTSSKLSGILSVSSVSGLCCLEMIYENIVIFTSQICIYDRKVLFNSELYFVHNHTYGPIETCKTYSSKPASVRTVERRVAKQTRYVKDTDFLK